MSVEESSCACVWYSENRGGGHFETMIEPDPDCPEHGEHEQRKPLRIPEIAAAAGLAADTVRFYHKSAVRKRLRGIATESDFPEPLTSGRRDGLTWAPEAIARWIEHRAAARERTSSTAQPPPAILSEIIAALDLGQIARARQIASNAINRKA